MDNSSLGFISVKVIKAQQDMLRDVALDAGVTPLEEGEYHCTVCYDVNNQDHKTPIPMLPFKEFEGTITGIEELGKRKNGLITAIAFTLDSEELRAEHELLKKVGHTHTFEDFLPHVSIAYKLTEEEADHLKFIAKRLIGQKLYFEGQSIEVIED